MDVFEERIEDYYEDNININFEKFINILKEVRYNKLDKKGFEESIKNLNFSSFINIIYKPKENINYQNIVNASSSLIYSLEGIFRSYKHNFNFAEPLGFFWKSNDVSEKPYYSSISSFFISSDDDHLVDNMVFFRKNLGLDLTKINKNIKFMPRIDIKFTNDLDNGKVCSYTFYREDNSKLTINTNIYGNKIKHTFTLETNEYKIDFDMDSQENHLWENYKKNVYRLEFINKKEGMLEKIILKSSDYIFSFDSLIEYREILKGNYKTHKRNQINVFFKKEKNNAAHFVGYPYQDLLPLLPEDHILHLLSDKKNIDKEMLFEPMMELYKNNFSINVIPKEIQEIAILYDINPLYLNKYDKMDEKTLTLFNKFEELRSNSFYALLPYKKEKKNVLQN